MDQAQAAYPVQKERVAEGPQDGEAEVSLAAHSIISDLEASLQYARRDIKRLTSALTVEQEKVEAMRAQCEAIARRKAEGTGSRLQIAMALSIARDIAALKEALHDAG